MRSHLCLRCECALPPLDGDEENDFRYICEDCASETELGEDECDMIFGDMK